MRIMAMVSVGVCVLVLGFCAYARWHRAVVLKHKIVLARDVHKVIDSLMRDARFFDGLATDGRWVDMGDVKWHGARLYALKQGRLWRRGVLIADHMRAIKLRCQQALLGILEIQIQAQDDVLLVSHVNLRMRS